MTDVITSVGVVVGVVAVAVSGWRPLDPIVAIAVALNIVVTGVRLINRSGGGLMDRALPSEDLAAIETALAPYREDGIGFRALKTRRSGSRSFISLIVLAPSDWTIANGHELLEKIERDIVAVIPYAAVATHLEPSAEEPEKRSWIGRGRARRRGPRKR
jgi:cation diffusion facilitator family transporter